MKKLSLGKLRLRSEELLQRGQLASVYGGLEGSACWLQCDDWTVWRPVEVPNCGQGSIMCSSGYQCNCT